MLPHHKTILYFDLDLLCVEKGEKNYLLRVIFTVFVCKKEVNTDSTTFCDSDTSKNTVHVET